jgi:hypothetical protein
MGWVYEWFKHGPRKWFSFKWNEPPAPCRSGGGATALMADRVVVDDVLYCVYLHEIPITSEAWQLDAIPPRSPDVYWRIEVCHFEDDYCFPDARAYYPEQVLAEERYKAILEEPVLFWGLVTTSPPW